MELGTTRKTISVHSNSTLLSVATIRMMTVVVEKIGVALTVVTTMMEAEEKGTNANHTAKTREERLMSVDVMAATDATLSAVDILADAAQPLTVVECSRTTMTDVEGKLSRGRQ